MGFFIEEVLRPFIQHKKQTQTNTHEICMLKEDTRKLEIIVRGQTEARIGYPPIVEKKTILGKSIPLLSLGGISSLVIFLIKYWDFIVVFFGK